MSRTVMSSIMRRRRGLISAMWKLLSEGWDRHPHPLRQETRYATKPLTPRQRLRSIAPRVNQLGTAIVSSGGFGLVLSSPERPGHDEAGSDRWPEQNTRQ